MAKSWYSYSTFHLTRDQVIWGIKYLELLKRGHWPPEPVVTGYEDRPIAKKSLRSEAGFVKPAIIAAELTRRLKRTGVEGKLLVAEINSGIEEYGDLQWESKKALNYISIWDFRKRPSYKDWKKWRKYYQKVVKK